MPRTADARTPPHVSISQRLGGLVRVTHPVPVAMYMLLMVVLAPLAALSGHRALSTEVVVRLVLAMGCAQASIGILNDYCDRALDAASKPRKPLVRGTVQPGEALALVVMLAGLAVIAAQPFGLGAVLILCAIMALGFAYDLRFKGTWVSALLFALHFPLLPIFVWVALSVWQPFLPWILPLGAALGIAMNIANSLPDLSEDIAAGVRGLPHVLGLRRNLALVWGIPPALSLLIWLLHLAGWVPGLPFWLAVATLVAVVTTVATVLLYRRRPTAATLTVNFYIQAFGAMAFAACWLVAVIA
ncbi:MAG TPA: UbiA family prenyltransferase [Ktedonobacterales bacterium]